jgi:hypothetical protein
MSFLANDKSILTLINTFINPNRLFLFFGTTLSLSQLINIIQVCKPLEREKIVDLF